MNINAENLRVPDVSITDITTTSTKETYHFTATPSASTSVPAGLVWTKVTFGTLSTGSSSYFSSSRFTAPVAGTYSFSAVLTFSATNNQLAIAFYVNGVNKRQIIFNANASNAITGTLTDTLVLAADDYVEVYALNSGTTVNVNTGAQQTTFSGICLSTTETLTVDTTTIDDIKKSLTDVRRMIAILAQENADLRRSLSSLKSSLG